MLPEAEKDGVAPQVADKPHIAFDESLPISCYVDEIRSAIENHQVIVVAGETGSGKTTQLPKIALLAGRKQIGHTQPRRIAARTVAERIAFEMGEELGETVGYQVRFTANVSKATQIKVMTDGIMLAEISQDRKLRRYDTIIIDEAHERSLNIDFLLGYLKQLVTFRPELRVIITSATIDTQAFSKHFSDAPIIEVEGRTYPVEVRYQPPLALDDSDPDMVQSICAAVTQLHRDTDGDILVFCPGERQIRDAADAIAGLNLRFTQVLQLYARLPAAKQHEVFAAHRGRRVVLATNIAETSVTVPGIRAVVDSGLARISRYSPRSKVQRLPIEPISQASANQRAGRCGRLGPGICIRLYSEEDFIDRPEYSEPEILRTSLASVILQMAWARLGRIENFGFIDPPDTRQVSDGMRMLRELGALAPKNSSQGGPKLSEIGRQLAQLPIDPRLGRMLIEGQRQGCLREVQAIVAGLSIVDVREYPQEEIEKAELSHRRFLLTASGEADDSDIAALVALWNYLKRKRRELSSSAFRRLCRAEYLNFMRVREWQELNTQLKQICADLKMQRNTQPATLDRVHIAVLAGLLSHVGALDERDQSKAQPVTKGQRRRPMREYLGAHGTRFSISRGSAAAKTLPSLVAAVELIETNRLWAHYVAPIQPEWVIEVGKHLIRSNYSEPHWSESGGQAVASEKVTLLSVPIIPGRSVSYGAIDPAAARQIFITEALVAGRWHTRHSFWKHNLAVVGEARRLEDQARQTLVDDLNLYHFYDERLPAKIVSTAHFDTWWKRELRRNPRLLDLQLSDVVPDIDVQESEFPQMWTVGGESFPLRYSFDPGSDADGVTVKIPLEKLSQVDAAAFTWQIPALRVDLATEMIRKLPKTWRAPLAPAPDTAKAALAWLDEHPSSASFPIAFTHAIQAVLGIEIPPSVWNTTELPGFLKVHYQVDDGKQKHYADSIDELRERLSSRVDITLNKAASHLTHKGATIWDFGALPEVTAELGYPALVDQKQDVGVRVFENEDLARQSHIAGIRRLIALNTPDTTRWVVSHISNQQKWSLSVSPYESVADLLAETRLRAITDLLEDTDIWMIRAAAAFDAALNQVRPDAADAMLGIVAQTATILDCYGEVFKALEGAPVATKNDVKQQLDGLLYDGFIMATDKKHFARLNVYLKAMLRRIVQAIEDPARDERRAEPILELEDEYAEYVDALPSGPLPMAVQEVGWMIEEYRVSVFALQLKAAIPVSPKRIRTALSALNVD